MNLLLPNLINHESNFILWIFTSVLFKPICADFQFDYYVMATKQNHVGFEMLYHREVSCLGLYESSSFSCYLLFSRPKVLKVRGRKITDKSENIHK